MTRVIKIGGAIVDNQELLNEVLDRCASLNEPFVLVHGGGKIATQLAQQLGVEQTVIDGRRVTDADTLRVVTMAYAGLVNKNVVAQLQSRGVQCLGMTGADADLVRAHKRIHPTIDYGFVGDIDSVNTEVLTMLLQKRISVVVAPLTHDGHGSLLNTNADTMAARIAMAMNAVPVRLHYVFEHPGVMRNIDDPDSLITEIRGDEVDALISAGIIDKGMLPKIANAVEAAQAGVSVLIQGVTALGTDTGTMILC
ncbi:MAG: acetylglutamate kinase [Candidatus Kapabacteria bacterium]|nr:acetylglutamate kinase [Candidatus Kapabacteria bacterium]